MRVLVCGSRNWEDPEPIRVILAGLLSQVTVDQDELVIIDGGARGADRIAREWYSGKPPQDGGVGMFAGHALVSHATFLARWNLHGKAAGPRRNQEMIDAHPDVVYAFTDDDLRTVKSGTADTVRRARAAFIPVYVVSHE